MSAFDLDAVETVTESDEAQQVRLWRFREARKAGLTLVEARLFSESTTDVGLLRKCADGHCPPALIAKIVI